MRTRTTSPRISIGLLELIHARSCRQGALDGPSARQAMFDGGATQSSSLDPHTNRKPLAIELQQVIRRSKCRIAVAFVIGLFLKRGPTAILGCVWSVIVNAIERQAVRTRSHVFQELCEVGAPVFAHVDTTAAVVLIVLVRWIFAAIFRCRPNHIFERSSPFGRGAVRCETQSRDFAAQATAALCRVIDKAWTHYTRRVSAATQADPSRMFVVGFSRSAFQNNQTAIALACQVM